jgi:phage terminase large subunit
MEHDYKVDPGRAAHVWGGEYVQAIEGAYYSAQLTAMRAEGRHTMLSLDPIMRVRAFWDLGRRDATAIWIAQFVGKQIHLLDYIEGKGQEMSYYIEALHSGGWSDALCVLPHDGAHVTVIAKGSAQQQLRAAGFETKIIPNQGQGAALKRVEAARRLFPRIWFNETPGVSAGLKALGAYHEKRDERRNIGLGPLHDWASDPADAFGIMCVAYEEPGTKLAPDPKMFQPTVTPTAGGWAY